MQREVAEPERGEKPGVVFGRYISAVHCLAEAGSGYYVWKQIGRHRQTVRAFFHIDKGCYLEATVGRVAVCGVEFIQEAVDSCFSRLIHFIAGCSDSASCVACAPVEFNLFLEIVRVAVVHVCQVAVGFLCTCYAFHRLI